MNLFDTIQSKLTHVEGRDRLNKLFEECKHLIHNHEEELERFASEHRCEDVPTDPITLAEYNILLMMNAFNTEDDDAVEMYFERVRKIYEDLHEHDLICSLFVKTGQAYLEVREYETALKYHLIAKELLKKSGDDARLSHVLADIGLNYLNLGAYVKAMEYTRSSIEISERLGNLNLVFAYNNYASIYYSLKRSDKALKYYLFALKKGDEMSFHKMDAHILNNIANIYSDKNNFEKAHEYYIRSLACEATQEEKYSRASTINNIGIIYSRQKQFDEAIQWFEKSIAISEKYGLRETLAKNHLDMSHVFAKKNDHQRALTYLDKAEKLFVECSVPRYLLSIFVNRAEIMLAMNQCAEAEKALKSAMEIVQRSENEYEISRLYETFTALYLRKGDSERVIDYQKKLIEAQKEEYKADYNQKLAEMQASFEVEQKEKEAEIYRIKAVELQNKNDEISAQKVQLEKTLHQLRKSEISYEFLNNEIKERLGFTIIGESQQMKQILNLVQRVAQSSATSVLITGETGTGKELVARAIHECSSRKNENFCAVNISSIPETLFESEFFGYKKNAFTGAKEDKTGWFEIANDGTLFLDEIGTWLPQLQSKFLRVLESKKIIPVGSEREIEVDFRLISATNDNLQEMIDENRFRADLYYRLSSFVINIPPLRERVEDIPALLEYFVKHLSSRQNKRITRIEKQVESALMSYPFPGNVRELKNMIERAVILSSTSVLKLSSFTIPKSSGRDDSVIPLATIEREMVLRALKQSGFHQRNAAKLLGITPKSLERRMIKHEIKREK